MEMEQIQATYVFMIIMVRPGRRLEQILMVRRHMITLVLIHLYPLMVLELQLVLLLMMELAGMQMTKEDTFVFMITMVLHGCRLEQILTEKQQMIGVVRQFLYPLMVQELQLVLLLMMEMERILVM